MMAGLESISKELQRYPFRPPLELRNPHAQTFLTAFLGADDEPYDGADWLTLRDGDRIRYYYSEGERGVVLLLHGLEGSAQSTTMRRMAMRLRRRGFAVVAVEYRGCSGEMNKAPRLYFSGDSEELSDIVQNIRRLYNGFPLFVVGFSLGGNLLLKWLGEQGSGASIDGAAALSPPFDLVTTGPHLDKANFGIYGRHFLKSLVKKAKDKARQFPGLIDYDAQERCSSIVAYDDLVTAPLHGFKDVWDYYRRCSCGSMLDGIRVPTLIVAAADDPINPGYTIPREKFSRNPSILSLVEKRGGHLGFFRRSGPLVYTSWAEEQAERFMARLAKGL